MKWFRPQFCPLVAALFLAAVPGGVDAQTPSTISVNGQILDGFSGEPIAEATIVIPELDRYAITLENGTFSFVDIPEGSYELVVIGMGYLGLEDTYLLEDGDYLRLELDPQPLALDAVVVNADRIEEIFEERRTRSGVSVRLIERETLERSSWSNALQFVRGEIGLVYCAGLGGEFRPGTTPSDVYPGCVFRRNRHIAVAVFIDEEPSQTGIDGLALYHPSDLYSIEVRNRGQEIRAFTHQYIQRVADGRASLPTKPLPIGGVQH